MTGSPSRPATGSAWARDHELRSQRLGTLDRRVEPLLRVPVGGEVAGLEGVLAGLVGRLDLGERLGQLGRRGAPGRRGAVGLGRFVGRVALSEQAAHGLGEGVTQATVLP